MTAMIIVAALMAIVLVLFLGFEAWARYSRPGRDLQLASAELIPVDLEAFENLVDPEEERYLRMNLSAREFRGVQRGRIRAAKMYVAALSQNAAVLVSVGQSARSNANPEVGAVGQEIVHRAIRLRIWCLFSLLRMDAAFLFPGQLSPSNAIASQYMLVTYMAAKLPSRAAA